MIEHNYKTLQVYPLTHEKISKIVEMERTTTTKFMQLIVDIEYEKRFGKVI